MKSMLSRVKNHWKKIIIHLKRHHRKYLFGVLCSWILALIAVHTANTINNIFASEIWENVLNSNTFGTHCNTWDDETVINIFCTWWIEKIEYWAFSGYSNISWLYLSGNNISEIESWAFSWLTIEMLDLSYNKLSTINSEIFIWNTISWLDLRHNQISDLEWIYNLDLSWLNVSGNCLSAEITEILNGLEIDNLEWIAQQKSCFYIEYNPNSVTSWGVEATLTLTWQWTSFVMNYSGTLTFSWNWSSWFIVSEDLNDYSWDIINYPENWIVLAEVDWIDKNVSCDTIEYSTSSPTSWNVEAVLTWCNEPVIVTNNNWSTWYEFTGNGTFTFEFMDLVWNTWEKTATVTRIDRDAPSCSNVRYTPDQRTNHDVVATFTRWDTWSWPSSGSKSCTITGNNLSCSITITDNAGNSTWCTSDIVTRIDRVAPTCDTIEYSTQELTNQEVRATLTWCSETGIVVTNNNNLGFIHPFIRSWSFTFEFRDRAGNTWEKTATVTRIDRTPPTCEISYETQWNTGNTYTIATLYPCSEEIINVNSSWYKVFEQSWEFTFIFKDLAGNTWEATARVSMPRPAIQVRSSGELMWLYNQYRDLYCEYNYKSWTTYSEQILLYMKNWKYYEYIAVITGNTLIDNNTLYKDNKVYWWWSVFGSWVWLYASYRNLDIAERISSLYYSLGANEIFMCSTWVNDSVFELPNNIRFYAEGHSSPTTDEVTFSINVNDTIKAGEYTDFTVKVMKDGQIYRDYVGKIYFNLLDKNWNPVDSDLYDVPGYWFYDFESTDNWRKTFRNWLRIEREWTYKFEVYDLSGDSVIWSETIVVKWHGASSNFEYDTLSFNPKYSDEINEAYQYARYYDITTIDSIKDAWMSDWLNRIAMAKMLANYAINVLDKDDFDTSEDCTFEDVSEELDEQFDYWVTKACQLWIMWVNMPNNKFYPKWWVTRAEFATALSRLLYWIEDWEDKYYSTHIKKLKREWIITNTDPTLKELRWYVMLMLKRAAEQ